MIYEQAYAQYAQQIKRFIANHVDPDEADDLAQETWLKAWRNWPTLSDSNVKSWLYTVALNTIRDHVRRRALVSLVELSDVIIEYHPSPVDEIAQIEDVMIMRDLLADIPAKSRDALLLRYAGYSHVAIAQRLNVRVETIKMCICRAHRTMIARRDEAI